MRAQVIPTSSSTYLQLTVPIENFSKSSHDYAAEVIETARKTSSVEDYADGSLVDFLDIELQYFVEECIPDSTKGAKALFIHLPTLFSMRENDSLPTRISAFIRTLFKGFLIQYPNDLTFVAISRNGVNVDIDLINAHTLLYKYQEYIQRMIDYLEASEGVPRL